MYNFADQSVATLQEICETFHKRGGTKRPAGLVPLPIVVAGAACFELLNACGLRNPINRKRIHKLIYSTNVPPRRLIEDGSNCKYDLGSAIEEWLLEAPMEPTIQGARRVFADRSMSLQDEESTPLDLVINSNEQVRRA